MQVAVRNISMVALASLCLGLAPTIQAQENAPNPGLQQKLNNLFVLTKFTADGRDIVTPGSVLVLGKDGLMMCDINAKIPLPNTYKGGSLSYGFGAKMKWGMAEALAQSGMDTNTVPQRKFVTGEKIWIVGLTLQNDGVLLQFLSDPYDNVRYHGDVKIQFQKGSPSADDAMKMVTQLVALDGGTQPLQAAPALLPPTQPLPALTDLTPPPPPPDESPAFPKTVSLGQTKNEVVAILGQPQKVAEVGPKEIDYYSDMKVTIVDGKVTDIQ